MNEVFQNKIVDNSAHRDLNNYCEIEAAPQYNTTCHQDTMNHGLMGFNEFDPYSELELGQTPASHEYDTTSRHTNRKRAEFMKFTPHLADGYYSETEQFPIREGCNDYDTTSHKGDILMKGRNK